MQERYEQADRATQDSLTARWEKAVSNAEKQGRFPEGVQLTLGFQPSEKQLAAWSTEKYNACLAHIPEFVQEAWSDGYRDHFQERRSPEYWVVSLCKKN